MRNNEVESQRPAAGNALPIHSILIFAGFMALAAAIWFTHGNHALFLSINSHHGIMPDKFWVFFNLVSYSKFFILSVALLIITYTLRREKLLNVILLIIAYYLLFAVLKSAVGEARPYIVLPEGSFFWLNYFEDAARSAHKSFPSGHTGNMAVFVFALNRMFFAEKKRLQFLMLAILLCAAFARVFTGWHWPLDVIVSGLIGYVLVKICFIFNFQKLFMKS